MTTVKKSLPQSRVKEMDSPASLEVISLTESDREHNISCANILADKASGVTVKPQGGIGSFAEVSIRGTNSGRVGIYLDDIPLNSGNGTLFNINSLSSALIGRMEIYKGNMPAGLGANGTGGVIRLITDKGRYGNDLVLGAGGGSYGYGSGTFQYNGSFPLTRLYASGEFLTAENDFPFSNSRGTAYNTGDDSVVTQKNDAVRQINGLIGASHVLPTLGTLSTMLFYNEGRKGLPGLPAAPTHTAFYYNQDVSGQVFYKSAPMDAVTTRTGLVLRNNSYTTYYPVNELTLISGHKTYRQDRERLAKLQSEAAFTPKSGQTLSLSGDASYEDFLPKDLTGENLLEALDASRYTGTGGLRYSLAGLRSETVFSGAAQVVRFSHAAGINRNTYVPIPAENEDRFYASGGLSSLYKFDHQMLLFTSANYLVQQPALYQLFGDKGAYVSNHALKPEKALNCELGLRYNCIFNELSWSGNLALFGNRLRDAIIMYRSFAQAGWVNADDALVYGAESDARLQWRSMHVNLSWTVQNPMNKTKSRSNGMYEGKMLPGQSRVNLANELNWSPSRFMDALYRLKFESLYYTDLSNSAPVYVIPSQTTHDVGLSFYPFRGWGIDLTVENITDANKFDVFGFPAPGRTYYVKTTYQINLKPAKELK